MAEDKEKKGTLGEVKISTDTEGHSVVRVGTLEMASAVKTALSNDKGVTIKKIGGDRKVCLSEPEKDYGASLCQIAEDIVE